MAQIAQSQVRNQLLRIMSLEDFAALRPHLQRVELLSGEALIRPHQPIQHLHFLESGISSITAEGSNGRIEVGMVGREGLVGAVPILLGSDRVPHDHFIQLPGEAYRVEADVVRTAIEARSSLRRLLLRYVQTEIVQVRQTAYSNAAHTIETRLARWLVMGHDRVDGDELLLKHEFLSMMLGVQRSGVTLALQNLEGGGCIRGRRGRVIVLDREALLRVADGSYGAAEAEYARLIAGS